MSVLVMTSLPVHLSLVLTLTITIHQCEAIEIGSMVDSILSSMTQNYIADEPTETVMNSVDTQYQTQFSERHGYHSQPLYQTVRGDVSGF